MRRFRLRGRPPQARFLVVRLHDRWFNADFPAHRCYLTGADIVLTTDGGYEVILGPDDPGRRTGSIPPGSGTDLRDPLPTARVKRNRLMAEVITAWPLIVGSEVVAV